jgi:hypothetical protein
MSKEIKIRSKKWGDNDVDLADVARRGLDNIVRKFRDGDIDEPLAQVFITRKDVKPMDKWKSLRNKLIVYLAGGTDARNAKAWGRVGRRIKDEFYHNPTIVILRPTAFQSWVKRDPATGEPVLDDNGKEVIISRPTAFIPWVVWDITQTNVVNQKLWDKYQANVAKMNEEIEDWRSTLPLIELADYYGFDIETFTGGEYGALGWYSPTNQQIALGVENLSTWAHELIHLVDDRLGNLVERGQNPISETVAEIGGAVLLRILGYEIEADLGGAYKYVESYAATDEKETVDSLIGKSVARIIVAVQEILNTADMIVEGVELPDLEGELF